MSARELYHIPRAAKDLTRILWVALGAGLLILLLSSWLATEYAALMFGGSPLLGEPMIGERLYFPLDILVWTWKYDSPRAGARAIQVFERAHVVMGTGTFLAIVVPICIAWRRTRKIDAERNDLHGSAH